MFRARAWLAHLVVVSAGVSAAAGPCIDCEGDGVIEAPWRYDRLLPGQPTGVVGRPDVAWPASNPDRLFAVFSGDGGASGRDVFLARSDDGGCNWTLRPIATATADEIEPTLAVDDAGSCVVVLFNRVTDATAGTGSIFAVASADGGSSFQPEVALSGTTAGVSRLPDVAIRPGPDGGHAHAVWQATVDDAVGSRQQMFYRRNIDVCGGAAPPAWVGAGARTNPDESRLSEVDIVGVCNIADVDAYSPKVAVDTIAKVAGDSSASIAFAAICENNLRSAGAPAHLVRRVFFLRSMDSGDSFWGDESTGRGEPTLIDDGIGTPLFEVAIDSSDSAAGARRNWNAVSWTEFGTVTATNLNAQAQEAPPPTLPSDWNATDVETSLITSAGLTHVAVAASDSAAPAGGGRVWPFWTDGPVTGPHDLFMTVGSLDAAQSPNVQLDCPSFQVTGLEPDTRAVSGGEAELPAADVNSASGDLFIAWVDTRNAADGEIFFKRTDREAPVLENLAARADVCPANDIEVSWTTPDCDVTVVHVTATGPDTVQVDVVPPATSVRLAIDDAAGDGSYDITVVAEDQACNVSPAFTLSSVSTPRCPLAVAEAPVLTVECNGGPDDDGEPDPGETVLLDLPVRNDGDADMTSASATLTVSSPVGGVAVIGGASSYPDVAVAATEVNVIPFELQLDAGVACPTTVDLDVDVTTDQGPTTLRYSFAVGANGCSTTCLASCDVDLIDAIEVLQAVKRPSPEDVELTWLADAESLDGYNVWWVTDKTQIAACATCPGSDFVPGCIPTGNVAATSCVHAGVTSGPAAELFHYNVLGVCLGDEAAQ